MPTAIAAVRTAARPLEDRDAARRAERELERLGARAPAGVDGGQRIALSVLAAAVAAAAGVGVGYLIADGSPGGSTETVTETQAAATETVTETTAAETETVTETITTTTTTVTTVTEPGPQ
jgi:hypothetical protein